MSRILIVRYRTHAEAADENARLIVDVFTALADLAPDGFRYSAYRLADEVSFVHVASLDSDDNPLAGLPEFAEFQRELPARCAELPGASEATVVGNYS